MPRDATETRKRLVVEAERLFATQGIYQARIQDIVSAAAQKNTSAVSYHFGSRRGLVDAILEKHGERLDRERAAVWADFDNDEIPTLIQALILPLARRLSTTSGRCYLRILVQLSTEFGHWDTAPTNVPANLNAILRLLRAKASPPDMAQRSERILGMIQLMVASLAERARQIEEGEPLDSPVDVYTDNLVDMLVGIITAPARVMQH